LEFQTPIKEKDLTMRPTPEAIEAELAQMLKGSPEPHDCDVEDLWWVTAVSPDGEDKGYGTDCTLRGSLVAAWILAWDDEREEALACWSGGVPISERFYRTVPRHVPDGWKFEICRPGEWPEFVRTDKVITAGHG
jgi:hypothetical protein